MERMEGASRDEVSANVEALKKVFPAVVKEGKVDMDALKTMLGGEVAADTGCYRMTWNGKEAARQFALKRSHGTLLPDRNSSRDWETTQNVYIEGDNLEVLKLLQGGYYNSVKMIYIDPPYNTGKDFVYHDNFHDSIENYKKLTGQVNSDGVKLKTNAETSGRYHTDWLNMMLPRLMLARNLLRDDGVIFISIDDNEVTNLRKICDEVFGEDQFIAQAVRKRRDSQANLSKNISPIHEYVVMYGRCGGEILNKIPAKINEDEYKNPDNDPRGPYVTMPCTNRGGAVYTITTPTGAVITEEWRFKKETYDTLYADNRIVFPRGGEGKPRYKLFLSEKKELGVLANSWWDELSSNQEASKEIKNLFSDLIFDAPKPVGLLLFCLQLASSRDSIILDFFSGSATTAHAVMQLNAEDGGNRKFIMVQLPESCAEDSEAAKAGYKNICEIGKKRILRAGDKVMAEWTARQNAVASQLALDGEQVAAKSVPPDIGFCVFKLDTSNFVDWNPNSEDLAGDLLKAKDNVLAGRTKEDILYEVIVKCNFQLTDKIVEHKVGNNTIHAVRNGELMVCVDDKIPLAVGDEMLRLKHDVYGNPESFRAVFIDNGLSDDSKANIVQRLKGDGVDETCIRCV